MKQIIRQSSSLIVNKLKNRQRDITCPNLFELVSETVELITQLLDEVESKDSEIETLYTTHKEITNELRKSKELIDTLIRESDDGSDNYLT